MGYDALAELTGTKSSDSQDIINQLIAAGSMPLPAASPVTTPVATPEIASTKQTTQPVGSASTATNPTVPINPPPAQSTTPSSTGPNWNSLKVGQQINGASVVDAKAFFDKFLANPYEGLLDTGYSKSHGGYVFGHTGKSGKEDETNLGRQIEQGRLTLLGYKPKFSGMAGATGVDYEGRDNSTSSTFDINGLKKAAAALGLDVSKYGKEINDTNAGKLQADVNNLDLKNYLSTHPDAIFSVDSHRSGKDDLKRNSTYYVQRGDRLIPVSSNDYKQESFTEGALKGSAMVIGSVLVPGLGPLLGGGITGAVASGAISGALNAGINGGNILKGAALGGLGGGVSSGIGSVASGLGASADVAKIIGGAAGGGVKGLVGKTDPVTGALMGGLNSTNFAGLAGLNLGTAGNSILNGLARNQLGSRIRRRG